MPGFPDTAADLFSVERDYLVVITAMLTLRSHCLYVLVKTLRSFAFPNVHRSSPLESRITAPLNRYLNIDRLWLWHRGHNDFWNWKSRQVKFFVVNDDGGTLDLKSFHWLQTPQRHRLCLFLRDYSRLCTGNFLFIGSHRSDNDL